MHCQTRHIFKHGKFENAHGDIIQTTWKDVNTSPKPLLVSFLFYFILLLTFKHI